MVKVIKTEEIAGIKAGRPDFTGEQNFVKRSQKRNKYVPRYNESVRSFFVDFTDEASLYTWVVPPLAPGETMYVPLSSTNKTTLKVPKGYVFESLFVGAMPTETGKGRIYLDGQLDDTLYMPGVETMYHELSRGFTTASLDPNATSAHTVRFQVENVGIDDAYGSVIWRGIMRKVGSPEIPKEKEVKCPYCDSTQSVKRTATLIKCNKCGEKFIVRSLTWGPTEGEM